MAAAIGMMCLIALLVGWNMHIAKSSCRYCGGYKGRHDNHCPFQGSGLFG